MGVNWVKNIKPETKRSIYEQVCRLKSNVLKNIDKICI